MRIKKEDKTVIGSAFHILKNKQMETNADKRLTKNIKTGITCNECFAAARMLYFPVTPRKKRRAHQLMTRVQKLKVVEGKRLELQVFLASDHP